SAASGSRHTTYHAPYTASSSRVGDRLHPGRCRLEADRVLDVVVDLLHNPHPFRRAVVGHLVLIVDDLENTVVLSYSVGRIAMEELLNLARRMNPELHVDPSPYRVTSFGARLQPFSHLADWTIHFTGAA